MSETTDKSDHTWYQVDWQGEPDGPPRLSGGRLSLDFANTVGGRTTEHPSEFLTSYPVLVSWGHYTGILGDDEAATLRDQARRDPDAAANAHRRAIGFRDTVYRVFFAIGSGNEPDPTDIDTVLRVYRTALDHRGLERHGSAYNWIWKDSTDDLERPLWSVAESVIEVLRTDNLDRIRVCPGGDGHSCQWVFFDTTKNGIRHWCSMAVCGSTAKSRRQVARKQAARQR
jgi:predicted RNA-binding Zn ribbon-like protein